MKRSALTAFAVLGVATIALAGCSNGGDDGGDTGGDGEAITLTVWESLEGRKDFIEQAGAAYTELHPNVTIEYKNVELGDAPAQIALDGPAGVGADVFAGGSNVVSGLVAGGHILPVADPDALTEALLPGAISNVTYEDEIWGVPITIDTIALFYNKEYVTEPPKTWDEVLEFSKEFGAANPGKYGIAFAPTAYYAAPFIFESPDSLLFGPDGTDPSTPNIDTDVAAEGLAEYHELRKYLDVPSDDIDSAVSDTLFESGQSAMSLTGSWNIAPFQDAGIDLGVTTIPAVRGSDTPAGGFANSRTMYVSAYSDHPDEAQDFAAFLASPDMLALAMEVTKSIPSADIPVDDEATAGLIAQGEFSFTSPSIAEANLYWTTVDAAVANIWNGADIEAELATAQQVVLDQ